MENTERDMKAIENLFKLVSHVHNMLEERVATNERKIGVLKLTKKLAELEAEL